MKYLIIGVIVIVIALVQLGIRYIIGLGVDKAGDAIGNAIDKKSGKMNETESESLSERYHNDK